MIQTSELPKWLLRLSWIQARTRFFAKAMSRDAWTEYQIVWRETYGREPRLIDRRGRNRPTHDINLPAIRE